MDPSEFEGTVEREADVVNAGVLENLLTTSELPKFQCLDLLKESQNVYLAIYNLQDILKQKENVNMLQNDTMIQEIEEYSGKIVEMKEEYLDRRQQLRTNVKDYLNNLPHKQSSLTEESPSNTQLYEFSKASENMMSDFKQEYDYLVSVNKYLETSFLSVVKHLQQIPDYHSTIEESLQICLKMQELIKNAQEQLNLAEKIVTQSCGYPSTTAPSPPTLTSSQVPSTALPSSHSHASLPSIQRIIHFIANQDRSSESHSRDTSLHNHPSHPGLSSLDNNHPNHKELSSQALEDLQDSYQSELKALKNQFDVELRNQQHHQLLLYQEKEVSITKHFEASLHQKEQEIHELLAMLSEHEMKASLVQEQEKRLSQETEKRQQLEEKHRQQLIDMTLLQEQCRQQLQQYESLQAQSQEQSLQFSRAQKMLEEKLLTSEKLSTEQTRQLQKQQQLLATLPREEEIRSLAKEIGYYQEEEEGGGGGKRSEGFSSRRLPSETSNQRERKSHKEEAEGEEEEESREEGDEERQRAKGDHHHHHLTWSKLSQFIQQTIRRLDKDLIAHRLKEQEALKTYQQLETTYQQLRKKNEDQEVQIRLLENEIRYASSPSATHLPLTAGSHTSNKETNRGTDGGSFVDMELNALLNPPSLSQRSSATSLAAKGPTAGEEEGATSPALLLPTNAAATTGREDYVTILQQQRNHYMRRTETLAQELQQLQSQTGQLEQERETLTNENMELYRRLRVLRVMQQQQSSPQSLYSPDHHFDLRSRRSDPTAITPTPSSSLQVGDPLDQKYHQLYESHDLNPYKIVEFERRQHLSSLHLVERWFIQLYQAVMKDATIRLFLVLYLLILHGLALCYLFQTLFWSTQVREEVDQALQDRWNSETFSLEEHPDLAGQ